MKEVILHRIIGASRFRWKFIVDDNDNILSEGPDGLPTPLAGTVVQELAWSSKPITSANDTATLKAENQSTITRAHIDILTKRGIQFDVASDGKITILKVPDSEKKISAFLDHKKNTCIAEVPNCMALKQSMLKEIDAAGGNACPNCELKRIKDKYRDLIQPFIK